MKRGPKAIGTSAETAVVKYARTYGYPFADRQPLRGNRDAGDITFSPGLIGEIKGGEQARTASDALILQWLRDTTIERENANATMALLVVARWQQPVERWWAVMWASDLADLVANTGYDFTPNSVGIPVRLLLRDALTLTRDAGYGDPMPIADPAREDG